MSTSEASEDRGIGVVGVDGSAGAGVALRWAAAEARLRNVPLRVVHAWSFGFTGVPGGGYGYQGATRGVFTGAGAGELRCAAGALLDAAIAEVAVDVDGVEIERQVVEGGAAEVLMGAADGADLLVVGSRGHGGFAGLLLGSVSQQCVHRAPCPVVIVHPAKPSARGSASTGVERTEQDTMT